MYNIWQKYFSSFVFIIKILIIGGAYYIISNKLLNDDSFNSLLWTERIESKGAYGFLFLLLLVFFTLVNWNLEILKWRSLVKMITKISFLNAAKQSLASLTASLITPNRIGEYGAKAIYYSKNHRPKILVLNFLSNFNQMFVTIVFGIIGLLFLRNQYSFDLIPSGFIIGGIGILVFVLFLLVYHKNKWNKNIQKVLSEIQDIPAKVHKSAFFYSIARYIVFSHQFYLLLLFFGVDLGYTTTMSLIFSMYLISSIIPGFVLFDWLVKGSVAVTLFGLFGVDEMIILSITAAMWILNFAIPASLGSFYVLTFKTNALIFSENKLVK